MFIPGVTSIDENAITKGTGKQTLGQEEFMNLLLKELNYQDPLNPMDSKEFTAQLTQFNSLEQLTNINDTLNGVLAFQQSMQNTMVTNLIGKSVSVNGDSSYLDGSADMAYDLQKEASSVKILVRDASGKVVRVDDLGPQEAGDNLYEWNGRDDLGNQMPDAAYTFEIEALNSDGALIETTTQSSGIVTDVLFRDDLTYLVLDGGRNVYLSDVRSVGLLSE